MIAIKPHHFVDIITVFGDGRTSDEPHPFGHALHLVSREVLGNRDVQLRMELGADDICAPCRHNINGLCDDVIDTSYRPDAPKSKREWNLIIDLRWCGRLGIKQDDRMAARQLCEIIRERAGDITDIYREIPAARTGMIMRLGVVTFCDR